MWVFGYGSLIWQPGFPVAEQVAARLPDWHRSFCMWSIHHRGTEANPGLVLALDAAPGRACLGLALKVAPGAEAETLAYLRERELVSSAYLEREVELALTDGRSVRALAYVVDPGHRQYCGDLTLERQAQVILGATGGRGPNRDYLWNTQSHLDALGLGDPDLDWLAARVRHLAAGETGGASGLSSD
ncbi:gamma-glutamylcyclotransferase [Frigidibacter sp. MR17.24]|uniref:gamma-glutamylcyclotransferase n=1 Tax=Frigidibacter sp. MR17.24 TaxID=3127345 RepID=UPI003012FFDE